MTEHLTDDVLAQLAGPARDDRGARLHLEVCGDCRVRLEGWDNVGTAVRSEAAEQSVAPPSFDVLIGPLLSGAGAAAADDSRKADAGTAVSARNPAAEPASPALSWRTAWQLVLRQAVLMPRSWAPLSAAVLVGVAVAAAAQSGSGTGVRLFGAAVVLVSVLGALLVASPRRDPRRELLYTLPVSPVAVFLARLTVVLAADVGMAMAASALVDGPGWWPVVLTWLGESLLAASLALALAVRVSPAAGTVAGSLLWLAGVVGGPGGLISTPADALLEVLLSTSPWTLALTLALLGWAAGAMRSYAPRTSDG